MRAAIFFRENVWPFENTCMHAVSSLCYMLGLLACLSRESPSDAYWHPLGMPNLNNCIL
jgi:hypothetical protein